MRGKTFALALWLAALVAAAQSPDGALQPPVKPNEEMVKWLETVDAQWQATFAQEVTAPVDAEKAKLAQQYSAGLEANLAKASAAGNLDLTVLWRNERDRFASEKSVPAEDDAKAPAELQQLQATWRAQMARLEKDRAMRAKSIHGRYDQVLAQAQTQLTQKQRIEDALLVKNRRDEIAARWLPLQSAVAVGTPAVARPQPTPNILIGARLAERMDLYASGNNGCIIRINGKDAMTVSRDKASKIRVGLREGDILAVRLSDRFDINSFWLSCIASTGEFLFETSEAWIAYIPDDTVKWWVIKNPKSQQQAEFAPDKREYVKLVKESATKTPIYSGAQPICSSLSDGTRMAYVYYVVKKVDLIPKKNAAAIGK